MLYPNPRHLHAFVILAECRSFSTAAATFGLGQPALSQAIAKLEEIVGVRLLERTTRSVVLTAAGEDFLIDAQRVLRENERLLSHGKGWSQVDRGHLSILTLPSVAQRVLPHLLRAFNARHAGIKFSLFDSPDHALRQRLAQEAGDIAIMSETSASGGMKFLPFLDDEFRVLIPAGHPLAQRGEITLRELSDQRIVLQRRGMLLRQYVDSAIAQIPFLHEYVEVNDVGTVIGLVEAEMGMAILPGLVCPSPHLQSVAAIPITGRPLSRKVGFVRSSNVIALPALQAFARFALELVDTTTMNLPDGVTPVRPTQEDVEDFLQ